MFITSALYKATTGCELGYVISFLNVSLICCRIVRNAPRSSSPTTLSTTVVPAERVSVTPAPLKPGLSQREAGASHLSESATRASTTGASQPVYILISIFEWDKVWPLRKVSWIGFLYLTKCCPVVELLDAALEEEGGTLIARKVGEAVQNTLGAVVGAIDIPLGEHKFCRHYQYNENTSNWKYY